MKHIKQKVHKKKNLTIIFLSIIFVLVIFLVVSYFTLPGSWNQKDKFSIVRQDMLGNVTIEILDPQNFRVSYIKIPPETLVEAGNRLGTWKLGSITKLGNDKKLNSDFLKNTIIKSFYFPVESSSNLKPIDQLRIKIFLSMVGSNTKEVNLADSTYLESSNLPYGSSGYKIALDEPPANIKSYFSENLSNSVVAIYNATGFRSSGIMVGKVLDVLGTNVVSLQNLDPQNFDCKIIGKEKAIVEKISSIFGCDFEVRQATNNFDIQVNLGSGFKDKF